MKEFIKIASGQGFWGDLIDAPYRQVTEGDIDYLVMDYLAEVTMSILQKQKIKNPELGYARDIPGLMKKLLPVCKEKKIRIITNGGGVNPRACAKAVAAVASELGINDLKIAVVSGDDIMERMDEITSSGCLLNNMDTGEPVTTVKDKLISANAYLGAVPIAQALDMGADIVITGRTTDTGLTLAPMIHEFGWDTDNFDLMAAGTVAGHILECGAQATGGNFLGDWEKLDFVNIGFPIAVAYPDGSFHITKHEGTGGAVNIETVSEQLLYEIGDPVNYITPDCIADFTSIQLEDAGKDKVKVHSIKGRPATPFLKVSAAYLGGYISFATLTYSWPDAFKKAKLAGEILRGRLDKIGVRYEEFNSEYVGLNACHGPLAKEHNDDDINEVCVRFGIRSSDYKSVERFGMEIAPLILTGPPAVTGFAGGRPKPSEVVAYWPALIPKYLVKPVVELYGDVK
ncbi:MAG: DUF1446 domain-containing protein [Ignavibacteriaceae bacterium]|nr:DUF1446 domain-containing protein [Ignavibacteriaceae bacterium]